MKLKSLTLVTLLVLVPAAAYAQNELAGKWRTAPGGSATSERQDGAAVGQPIVMELNFDGNKLSGTMTIGNSGETFQVRDVMLMGKSFTFRLVRRIEGDLMAIENWRGEITDANTISISLPGRARGGQDPSNVGGPGAPPPPPRILGNGRGTVESPIVFHRI